MLTSGYILILANLVPLCGAMFWGWGVNDLMILFWMENVIIGLLNVVKMATMIPLRREFAMIPMIPFFTLHYGMFTFVHGIFVLEFFGGDRFAKTGPEQVLPLIGTDFPPEFLIPLIALFVSHVLSLILNFIMAGEYRLIPPGALMFQPYGRVVVLHITIILGGMLVLATGETMMALVLLVILKTIIDLLSHHFTHKSLLRKEA
jgi:hypothetical protein